MTETTEDTFKSRQPCKIYKKKIVRSHHMPPTMYNKNKEARRK